MVCGLTSGSWFAMDSMQFASMLCARIHSNDLSYAALSSAMPETISSSHERLA